MNLIRKLSECVSLLGGVMLMILVSSGTPFREITTAIFASPAQTHVTSAGHRESSLTSLNVSRASVPFHSRGLSHW